MNTQNDFSSTNQSEAEWIRERNYWDAVMTRRSIIEEAEIRGMKRGFQQGLEKAQHMKTIEMVKNCLKENIPVKTIARCLDLPLEEVQKLAEEISKN